MTMKKVLLISRISPACQDALRGEFAAWRFVDCNQARDRVAGEIRDTHIVYGRVKPDEFARAQCLEFIQLGVQGIEYMNYPAVMTSAVRIANAKGLWSAAVAEHTLALVLALFRRIPAAVTAQQRRVWDDPGPAAFRLLRGAAVGCLGTGSVGRRVAELMRGFGAAVIGYNRTGEEHALFEAVYSGGKLRGFLGSCDVVVNSLPLTEKTAGFMNAQAFGWMKPGAVYINVGRGRTDDAQALIHALAEGPLAAAGLDVFAQEPLPADDPLWALPNVLITPHTAGNQEDAEQAVYELLAENLRRFRDGRPLLNLVDKAEGY